MRAMTQHTPTDADRPWLSLSECAARGDPGALVSLVESLSAGELARGLAHLDEEDQRRVLTLLPVEDAADLLEQLSTTQAADVVEALMPAEAAGILLELSAHTHADILGDLDQDDADAVLAALPAEDAAELRALSRWDDDVAGGLMTLEFVAVSIDSTVDAIVELMRSNAEAFRDYQVQYVYVVDAPGHLMGVLRLRDLLLATPGTSARALMIADPLSVDARASLDALDDIFEKNAFFGLPVTDDGRLVGVVRRASVEEALGTEAHLDHLKSQGIVGGEELRSMHLFTRSSRRLSWLSVNIALNVLAASVIAAYQDTLEAVIALAVFLPIISDMSGCSGNQAVAVSMRELSLGVARPRDLLYVWSKEVSVGLINGLALGLLLAGVAWLWKGNVYLGLVVGAALATNTVIAVSIGGTVPLALKGLGVDPALASGPVLTTITDLCGFLLVLGLATMMLPQLV